MTHKDYTWIEDFKKEILKFGIDTGLDEKICLLVVRWLSGWYRGKPITFDDWLDRFDDYRGWMRGIGEKREKLIIEAIDRYNEDADDSFDYRLSRRFDVVGFFDIKKPDTLLTLWQMHSVPRVGEQVQIQDGSMRFLGNVRYVRWSCTNGPFTVLVFLEQVE